MASDFDRAVMKQAIVEAKKGRTSPNPRVGAAIVHDGRIIALGYHARAGAAHAEVDAIRKAGHDVAGMTLYVTLEPCNHHGRTGPCTEAILKAGIARVVIGCRDPAPHVPGAIERLTDGGVEVEVGILEEPCKALVADFAKYMKTGLPHVTLKAAITLDGKVATRTGASRWITGEAARTEAHRLRDDADAVLVGVGTVLADDPALTVRHVTGTDPTRVILDADLRTPPTAAVVEAATASSAKTMIFHAVDAEPGARDALRSQGVDLVAVARHPRGVDLVEVLEALGKRNMVRLLVEGGAHVHGTFVDLGLADRAAIFIAPRILGDDRALSFVAGDGVESIERAPRLVGTEFRAFGPDLLVTGEFERTH